MSLPQAIARSVGAGPSVGLPSTRRLSLLAYASFVLIGWSALLIPALVRSIEDRFALSDAGLAVAFFFGAIGYAVGSLGGGLLTERVGRRVVLAGAALLLGAALMGEALAPSWFVFVAASIAGGIGAGAIDGGMNGLVMALFRQRPGGALNGLHLFFSVGALSAPFIVGRLVTGGVDWRAVVLATGVAAATVGVILATQRLPSGRRTEAPAAPESGTPAAAAIPLGAGAWPLFALAVAIGTYVAAEIGVSTWLVRFLAAATLETATTALAIFWAGLTLGRLLSVRIADRLPAVGFAAASSVVASIALAGAVWVPDTTLSIALFGVVGFAYAPIYPMIMAIAGALYPNRLAAVSGTLAASAVVGGIVYPPLMGLLSASLGIGGGMIGGAALGVVCAAALVGAGQAAGSRRSRRVVVRPELQR